MLRQAEESHDAARADPIRKALEDITRYTTGQIDKLARKYGALDTLSTQATRKATRTTQATPGDAATAGDRWPAGDPSRRRPCHPPANWISPDRRTPSSRRSIPPTPNRPADSCMRQMSPVLARCPASPGLPPPTPPPREARDLWRWVAPSARHRLRHHGRASGFHRGHRHARARRDLLVPAATGRPGAGAGHPSPSTPACTTPARPCDRLPSPPPPGRTTPALSPGAAFPTPSRVDDDVDVQRALLAGRLPPRFDASRLIDEARTFTELGFAELGLAEELEAGRLPLLTIDVLIDGYRANDEGGGNAPYIEQHLSLKENIERALHDAYPGRIDPQWLDQTPVLELMRRRGEPAAPSAASATVPAEFDAVQWIERHLGTGGGASHPAPLPPPSAAGRIGAGTGAPPPAADPWRIRPPGTGSEPHPFAFDPRSAPSGPSSQIGYTRAIRTPVISTGAPPRWLGAETPGFARAASGAVEHAFSRREEIAIRFGTADALLDAELTVQLGGADAIGWSATRWRDVLNDINGLNAIVQSDSAAAAAGSDVDWRAIEALMRILDDRPPSP